MTKKEYANKVAEIIGGEVRQIEKANGIMLTGITVMGEGDVSPIAYIDQPYKDGLSVEEAARELKKAIDDAMTCTPPCDASVLKDYKNIKPLLRARLYNRKTSADVFRSAEGYGFDDLIIIPYVQLDENSSLKVTRQMTKFWGVDDDEVISQSLQNIKGDVDVVDMETMLGLPSFRPSMFVVTSKERAHYGASRILFAKEKLERIFPEGYIVLPSSVHEVIVISAEHADSPIAELVCSVNDNLDCLTPEEVLGFKGYEFAA